MICGNDGCDDFKMCVEFLEMSLKMFKHPYKRL